MKAKIIHACGGLLLIVAGLGLLTTSRAADPSSLPPLAGQTKDGYAVPRPGQHFEFPRDHGSHPQFKIEWWYVTGHLFANDRRRFGFEATFFRQAGPRESSEPGRRGLAGAFGSSQIYLAHMALLDVASGQFLHQEILNREGWNAAASTNTLDLRNGNWSLRLTDAGTQTMKLKGGIRGEARFELELAPAKPLVVFGEDGVSRKAADAAAASHYLTFTRLKVGGELRLGQSSWTVDGQAWMDHEISSSQLGPDQAGWDWACLQLKDGREMMVYRLRGKDGSASPFSTLAWVDEKGHVIHQGASEFSWKPQGAWTSPQTGARYPLPVRLECRDPRTGNAAVFFLQPLALAQELTGSVGGVAYWEGACLILDEQGDEVGDAFMELTGYAGDLSQKFR